MITINFFIELVSFLWLIIISGIIISFMIFYSDRIG